MSNLPCRKPTSPNMSPCPSGPTCALWRTSPSGGLIISPERTSRSLSLLPFLEVGVFKYIGVFAGISASDRTQTRSRLYPCSDRRDERMKDWISRRAPPSAAGALEICAEKRERERRQKDVKREGGNGEMDGAKRGREEAGAEGGQRGMKAAEEIYNSSLQNRQPCPASVTLHLRNEVIA
ncbi:hypothetical protein EYF80_013003 [Liparis tanakae]|uniref:Uncharacterized protein n=1 Tax=Liparis tanakae TaxID=230148 RepID=A0A4Z2IH31_9TELE|nr:hypothetical protein EYF80_013003 [Liparis tanakae]